MAAPGSLDVIMGDGSSTNGESLLSSRKNPTGGWFSAFLLLVNQGLATFAFFGVSKNLVLFLTRVLGQDNASAANSVSNWTGTVYMCSLLGAFLSDSYWGRYLTCAIFQLILLLALGILSLSSWLFLIKPGGCGDGEKSCDPPKSPAGVILFNISIYMVALGYGGHQPTLATFGSDQFDELNPKEHTSKAAFFRNFYFALNCGCLFSNTILVYYEDKGQWTAGFVSSVVAAAIALFSFLLGSPRYRCVKAFGNPLPRVAQVFVAAARKFHLSPVSAGSLYEVEGLESVIGGSKKILHTQEFQCLDKAAIVTEEDRVGPPNPWRLCTVTQIEEAKCVIRILPVWLCTIVYSIVFTQMASLFVEQGAIMYSRIGKFHLPPASMSAFNIFTVLICTGVYSQMLVPLAVKLSGNPKGLTELQMMGTGIVIGLLSMVAAGVTEIERLRRVEPGESHSALSIFWQIPQYVLVGVSEVYMYVGQLEFFSSQAPDGIKSFASSLCMASIALGNFASSLLVSMVMQITTKGDRPGWIPRDLNSGHVDRFYFLLAALTALNFIVYLLCAKRYKSLEFHDESRRNRRIREEDSDSELEVDLERKEV